MTKEYWQLILMIIVAILGPAGAAYIGVKVSLNGFKLFTMDKLKTISTQINRLEQKTEQNGKDIIELKTYHKIQKK